MEEKDDIKEVAGWILRDLQEEEMPEGLSRFVAASEENASLYARLKDTEFLGRRLQEHQEYEQHKERDWQRLQLLLAEKGSQPVRVLPLMRRWWAAAAILCIVAATAAILLFSNRSSHTTAPTVEQLKDIAPGSNGAILTLADGSQVVLDSMEKGVVATQNGAQVRLTNGGLSYDPYGTATDIMYNTMTTPRGRQFQVTLPDGTIVWLNAASSITFPTAFKGTERRVKIKGEVYLEVAKDPKMPFRVDIGDKAVVEVLGTRFNINSYMDEQHISTTLLEGSVSVSAMHGPADKIQLKPGQQAQIPLESGIKDAITVMNDADIDKVMAWKNGAFNFEGSTMEEVMRQLERWYNIQVQFRGDGSRRMFGGKMGRNVSLANVLEMFRMMGVKYEWDGDVLTIF